jgi:hypothetical protein
VPTGIDSPQKKLLCRAEQKTRKRFDMNIVWSFSGLKTFQQCARKYYRTKVVRDIVEPDTKATLYGKSAHTVAEEYIRDGKEIPAQFMYMKPLLDRLNSIPGNKFCEVKLGITENLEACEYDAPNVWWHGIADLVVIDEEKQLAHSVDYKTSKSARYADTMQLDLIALGVFAKYPNIKKIKSALLFTVSGDLVSAEHYADKKEEYIKAPAQGVERLQKAFENDVWNPNSGPLCKFCSVKDCEYNRN